LNITFKTATNVTTVIDPIPIPNSNPNPIPNPNPNTNTSSNLFSNYTNQI